MYICCIEKKEKIMKNVERIENLTNLAKFMFDNHKEELFTSDDLEWTSMCEAVIRHEGLEQFDMTLEEVEVYYVKLTAMTLFTDLSLNNGVR